MQHPVTSRQHHFTDGRSLNLQPSPRCNPDICPTKRRSIFTCTWTLHTSLWFPINISPLGVALFSESGGQPSFFVVRFEPSWLLKFTSFDSACQKLWFIDHNASDNRGRRETGIALRTFRLLLDIIKHQSVALNVAGMLNIHEKRLNIWINMYILCCQSHMAEMYCRRQ